MTMTPHCSPPPVARRRSAGGLAAGRLALCLTAAALGLALPATPGLTRSKRPVVVEAPPPPPPPAPAGPVGLPDKTITDAAAYDSYLRRAVSISPAFTDAGAVSSALNLTRAYAPKSLIRGAVAYAAIAALQEPAFVASIREAGNTPEHREQMVAYILANPAYVYLFKDADVAAGMARAAVGPSGLRLRATGKAVRQSAYDIQKQGWSKSFVNDLPGRLAAAEAAANNDMNPDPEDLSIARQSVSGVSPLPVTAQPLPQPYTPLVAHALQLAAIGALGEATNANYDRLAALANDDDAQACLATAKRNFHQCLAVAKPNYEDIFCMGQHGLQDTGVCLANAAGVAIPPDPLPPAPPPKKKSAPRKHRRA